MAISAYLELMAQRVQDIETRLTPDDFGRALRSAVSKYSQDRPCQQPPVDLVVDGSSSVSLPDGFDADADSISNIEYPIGEFPPAYLGNDEWLLYQSPTGESIRFGWPVSVGGTVRVSWSSAHKVDDSTDTIPAKHLDAVADWASGLLCHDLATLYSGDSDPTITADSVDHNGKAREFAARSRTLAQRYYDAIGVDPKRNAAAGVVVDLDTSGVQGRPRLTHSRRFH